MPVSTVRKAETISKFQQRQGDTERDTPPRKQELPVEEPSLADLGMETQSDRDTSRAKPSPRSYDPSEDDLTLAP